jgi:hypothetical protein
VALSDNLVSYWKLDEESGSRVDAHSSNDLTDNNTVLYAAGKLNNAALMVNANLEYLSHVDNAELSLEGVSFFISFWAYLVSKVDEMVLTAKEDTSVTNEWEFRLDYRTTTDRFRWFVFSKTNGVVGSVSANELGAPSLSTWYHIVAYHDIVGDEVGIIVNDGTPDTAATTGYEVEATTGDFLIGNRLGGSGKTFDGRVDEYGLWKRTPDAQDITDLYNGGDGLSYEDIIGVAAPVGWNWPGWWCRRKSGLLMPRFKPQMA